MDEVPVARLCVAGGKSISVANDVRQFPYSSVQKNYNGVGEVIWKLPAMRKSGAPQLTMSEMPSLAEIPHLVRAEAKLRASGLTLICLTCGPVDCPTHRKSRQVRRSIPSLVPLAGLEPALRKKLDFESSASTNSATGALGRERGG